MNKKILIVSDTHGDLESLIELIESDYYDYVVHAGDFCVPLHDIKPHVDFIVAGNNDFEGEHELYFEIDEIKFLLTHGHTFTNFYIDEKQRYKHIAYYAQERDVDVIITGHTHVEFENIYGGILCINPGSLRYPRNKYNIPTYAVLEIDNKKISNIEIRYLNQ